MRVFMRVRGCECYMRITCVFRVAALLMRVAALLERVAAFVGARC